VAGVDKGLLQLRRGRRLPAGQAEEAPAWATQKGDGSSAVAYTRSGARRCWRRQGMSAALSIHAVIEAPGWAAALHISSDRYWLARRRLRRRYVAAVCAASRRQHSLCVVGLSHDATRRDRNGGVGGGWSSLNPYGSRALLFHGAVE
jgi:hypothetical protein